MESLTNVYVLSYYDVNASTSLTVGITVVSLIAVLI